MGKLAEMLKNMRRTDTFRIYKMVINFVNWHTNPPMSTSVTKIGDLYYMAISGDSSSQPGMNLHQEIYRRLHLDGQQYAKYGARVEQTNQSSATLNMSEEPSRSLNSAPAIIEDIRERILKKWAEE